jgi:hypothetical protein
MRPIGAFATAKKRKRSHLSPKHRREVPSFWVPERQADFRVRITSYSEKIASNSNYSMLEKFFSNLNFWIQAVAAKHIRSFIPLLSPPVLSV